MPRDAAPTLLGWGAAAHRRQLGGLLIDDAGDALLQVAALAGRGGVALAELVGRRLEPVDLALGVRRLPGERRLPFGPLLQEHAVGAPVELDPALLQGDDPVDGLAHQLDVVADDQTGAGLRAQEVRP